MASFFIVPSRLVAGGVTGQLVVTSLNGLINDITLAAAVGGNITITPTGQTLQIGVNTNTFILKAGDTVPGNIRFTPTGSNYGLAVGSGTTDPGSGVVGAIFYNTVTTALRIYNGASWVDLAAGGALTQIAADARYLKLDASNGPLTGDLSLGSTKLRLGNFNTAQPSGSEGQIIFRTDLNAAQLYAGGSWQTLGTGSLSITAGTGLSGGTITSTGTISVDTTYPFTWTGINTFSQPINFASAQTFAIDKLAGTGQTNGAMIYYNGSTVSWGVLAPGTANQVLKIDPSTLKPTWSSDSSGVIGTPTDTTYTDGFFDTWTASTTVANAVDDINELLLLLAPEKPGLLTSTSLSPTTVPTFYTVKLSDGLTNDWYYNTSGAGHTAGDTITTYFLTGSFRYDNANLSSRFFVGSANKQATYGEAYHNVYTFNSGSGGVTSSVNASYNLASTGTTGTTGTLTISNLSVYNNVWEKANAFINYTQSAEGWEGHSLSHSFSGETNLVEHWRDTASNSSPTPSFTSGVGLTEISPADIWLSGVKYYGYGSTFKVTFEAANNIFDRCYNATQVARVYGTGMNNLNLNPASPPAYNATYDRTGVNFVTVTLNKYNEAAFYQSTANKYLSVALFKAHGTTVGSAGTASTTVMIDRAINTYDSPSSNSYEAFFDEDMRVSIGSTSLFPSSTSPLVNGNAQVRNGVLCYPVTADYSGIGATYFSGDQQYERYFYKESASNGTLTFTGLSNAATDVVSVGSGQTSNCINILLQLIDTGIGSTTPIYYDLGANVTVTPIGSYGGVGTSNLYGGRFSATSSAINFSFGTRSTENNTTANLGRYKVIIIFKDSTKSINSITSS